LCFMLFFILGTQVNVNNEVANCRIVELQIIRIMVTGNM